MIPTSSTKEQIDKLISTINSPWWKFWISKESKQDSYLMLIDIGEPAIPDLINSLLGPGAAYATCALKDIGPACVPGLVDALNGKGHVWASLVLSDYGPFAIQPVVNAIEKSTSDQVIEWCAHTLGGMGRWAAPALPSLRRHLDHQSPQVKEAVMEAIQEITREKSPCA